MNSNELSYDQLAPHNIEAEEAVLGAILVNPECIVEVAPFLSEDKFFITRHAWIYGAMLRLKDRNDPIDYLTVVSELEQMGRLSETGGAAYVLSLVNKTPSSLNVEGYGRIVERMALRRNLLDSAQQIARAAHSDETDIDNVIAKSERALYSVTIPYVRSNKLTDWEIGEAVADNVTQAHEWNEHPDVVRGTPCGFQPLDYMSRGFVQDELIYVAGRPGHGKSTLLEEIQRGLQKAGAKTLLFSFEMSKPAVLRRMGCQIAKVDGDVLKDGKLTKVELERYLEAQFELERLGMRIVACGGLSVPRMENLVSALDIIEGVDFIFVDTINRVASPGSDLRHVHTNSSHALADLAHNKRKGVIAAAQLNREGTGKPNLKHLAEAGALEQDADGVYAVYSEYVETGDLMKKNCTVLYQLKNRDGGLVRKGIEIYRAPWPGFEVLDKQYVDLEEDLIDVRKEQSPYIMGRDND